MGGVRGDGEAVGEDAPHHLGRHEEQAEHGGQHQLVAGPGASHHSLMSIPSLLQPLT